MRMETRRALRVIRPGLRTTVEDLGRRGVAAWGVPPGGAFDAISLEAANLLVGNAPEAAGLEWTLRGPELGAEEDVVLALVGSDFGARLSAGATSRNVPLGQAAAWRKGETLAAGFSRGGSRGWMAVSGGIDVPPAMGSRSTDVASGFGGLAGRALRAGDTLSIGEAAGTPLSSRWSGPFAPPAEGPVVLRVLPGPQLADFPRGFAGALEEIRFRVGQDSNRTGVRLERREGPKLPPGGPKEIEPEGTTLGAIQLPGGLGPIALGPDRPTTGGYPKPALVAAADVGILARLAPGMQVRLRFVNLEEARAAWAVLRRELAALPQRG